MGTTQDTGRQTAVMARRPDRAPGNGRWWRLVAAFGLVLGLVVPAAAETTITIWSHEADEPAKVAWREKAARNFEAKNPDVKVKITWYDKPALNAALKTALRAGQGPDLFYAEPDQTEYIENGFPMPLDDLVNWGNIYDWARGVWTQNGKTYGLPQEAYTIELYYNKELMKKIGVTLPPNGQVGQAQFLDIVKKANAAGITPISQGVGDRPYPGATCPKRPSCESSGGTTTGSSSPGNSPTRIRGSWSP